MLLSFKKRIILSIKYLLIIILTNLTIDLYAEDYGVEYQKRLKGLLSDSFGSQREKFFIINPSFYYQFNEYKNPYHRADSTYQTNEKKSYHITSAFIKNMLLVGFKYLNYNQTIKNIHNSSNTEEKISNHNIKGLGLCFGIRTHIIQLTFSFIPSEYQSQHEGENNQKVLSNNKLITTIIDFSFLFGPENLKAGPQLSLYNFKFNHGNTSHDIQSFNVFNLEPSLTLSIEI